MTRILGWTAASAAVLTLGAAGAVLFGGFALAHGFYLDNGAASGGGAMTCEGPVQTINPATQTGPLREAQCVVIPGRGVSPGVGVAL